MWDPVPYLRTSSEPAARWIALVRLLGRQPEDAEVVTAHAAVLADPGTQDLLDRLVDWDVENPVSGHDKPHYTPNLLALVADLGVTAADDARIRRVLQAMLEHQTPDGRFLALGRWRGHDEPVWASLPCDHHAILETLARAGYGDEPQVRRGAERLLADLGHTCPGVGWECRPDPVVRFRGPGRIGDVCPQATLRGLRALSYTPDLASRRGVLDAARTTLGVWRSRAAAKPYMFGHGRQFEQGKWPATWYSAPAVVDTIGRCPQVWSGTDVDPDDRTAMAEVAACLLAYAVSADGTVIPRSTYRGFERHSFGRKAAASDVATALVAVALARVEPIWPQVEQVDVGRLASSKGGAGTPLPPIG